jgi:hypothetical protein
MARIRFQVSGFRFQVKTGFRCQVSGFRKISCFLVAGSWLLVTGHVSDRWPMSLLLASELWVPRSAFYFFKSEIPNPKSEMGRT